MEVEVALKIHRAEMHQDVDAGDFRQGLDNVEVQGFQIVRVEKSEV